MPFTPAIPTGLIGFPGNLQIAILGNNQTDADGFNLYSFIDDYTTPVASGSGTTPSFGIAPLVNGTAYSYKVTATNSSQGTESAKSDIVTVTPRDTGTYTLTPGTLTGYVGALSNIMTIGMNVVWSGSITLSDGSAGGTFHSGPHAYTVYDDGVPTSIIGAKPVIDAYSRYMPASSGTITISAANTHDASDPTTFTLTDPSSITFIAIEPPDPPALNVCNAATQATTLSWDGVAFAAAISDTDGPLDGSAVYLQPDGDEGYSSGYGWWMEYISNNDNTYMRDVSWDGTGAPVFVGHWYLEALDGDGNTIKGAPAAPDAIISFGNCSVESTIGIYIL